MATSSAGCTEAHLMSYHDMVSTLGHAGLLQVKKMAEHDNFVNSCCPLRRGPPLLVSGSDDGTAKVRAPLLPEDVTFGVWLGGPCGCFQEYCQEIFCAAIPASCAWPPFVHPALNKQCPWLMQRVL